MNYSFIYQSLIEKRRKDVLTENYHIHHIVPRCLNGSNEPENLVRLSYREHCIAHILLCKIHEDDKNKENFYKLCYAVQMMSNSILKKVGKFNSRLYSKFIKIRNKHVGEMNKVRLKNTTIFKNIKTGEHRVFNINDKELLLDEWVGINKGIRYNGKKGLVTVIDEQGNIKKITKEEFDSSSNYKGINAGKKGLFNNINEIRQSMKWWERILYSDCHRQKPKDISNKPNLLYLLENIYTLVPKMLKYKNVPKAQYRKVLEENIDKELFSPNTVLVAPGHDVIRRIIERVYLDKTPFIYDDGFREALSDYLKNFNREIKYEDKES